MKRILVPTDFSANSKSGIRFAIFWSSRQDIEVVFIHVLYIPRPTRWSDSYFSTYAAEAEMLCRIKFEKFITAIYRSMSVKKGKHSFIILQGISADISILDYCNKKRNIDFICMSTRGAGKFKRIFGTHTGNLITKSKVPVMAIPKNYKVAHIQNVLYATDLRDYPNEVKKVIDFALPFKASVDVLHFSWPGVIPFDEKIIESSFKKKYSYDLQIYIEKYNADFSLIENLQHHIKLRKSSVVIMFTNQERTVFQKLFLSSKAEKMSFQLKAPLLVFNKF